MKCKKCKKENRFPIIAYGNYYCQYCGKYLGSYREDKGIPKRVLDKKTGRYKIIYV